VASSVATEKANRVAEVLLAVVPARSLLYGKVLGVGVVGFATVAIAAVPLLAKTLAGGNVPESFGTTLMSSGAWLAGGIVIYLLLAAMLGALADRTEDVGGAVAPLTVGLIAIYLASLGTTETTVGVVLSIVPLSSPIAMPARLAIGAAEPWEIVASLVALAAAVVLIARLAVTVYSRAIVRTGRRLKLLEVLRTSSTRQ
jgi:ABC-2 type transport system permease protein